MFLIILRKSIKMKSKLSDILSHWSSLFHYFLPSSHKLSSWILIRINSQKIVSIRFKPTFRTYEDIYTPSISHFRKSNQNRISICCLVKVVKVKFLRLITWLALVAASWNIFTYLFTWLAPERWLIGNHKILWSLLIRFNILYQINL